MINCEVPLAGREPGGAAAQPWRKAAMAVVATLLLIIAFAFAFGLVGASATTANPGPTSSYTTVSSDPPLPCNGEKPGTCP